MPLPATAAPLTCLINPNSRPPAGRSTATFDLYPPAGAHPQRQTERPSTMEVRLPRSHERGVSRRVQSTHARSASTSHAHPHDCTAHHMSHVRCTCSRHISWQGWAAQSFTLRLRARVLSSRPAPAVCSTGRWLKWAAAACMATEALACVCVACARAV